ncbi:MAG: hypothetical protein JO362_22050 [Streptomycetaceae bacterium]|nr:hypothetical protein [Streptomycetaceae bacterium]
MPQHDDPHEDLNARAIPRIPRPRREDETGGGQPPTHGRIPPQDGPTSN